MHAAEYCRDVAFGRSRRPHETPSEKTRGLMEVFVIPQLQTQLVSLHSLRARLRVGQALNILY